MVSSDAEEIHPGGVAIAMVALKKEMMSVAIDCGIDLVLLGSSESDENRTEGGGGETPQTHSLPSPGGIWKALS